MFYLFLLSLLLHRILFNNFRANLANGPLLIISNYVQNLRLIAAKMRCVEGDVVLTVRDSEHEGGLAAGARGAGRADPHTGSGYCNTILYY